MSWTDNRVEKLKDLWAEGLSASVISGQLGVSRSAVLGKVHRLGLSGRPASTKKPKRKSRAPKKTSISLVPKSPELPKHVLYKSLREPPLPHKLVPFENLEEGQCKFVIFDPVKDKHWGYCGKPSEPGSNYCRDCQGIVT